MRQDDPAAAGRGLRAARHGDGAGAPQGRGGLPAAAALPVADRGREPRLRPGPARGAARGAGRAHRGTAGPGGSVRHGRAPHLGAVGRSAAAGGDRPGARRRTAGPADGRAVRRARRPHPGAPPGGGPHAGRGHRHDGRLRDALRRGGRPPRLAGPGDGGGPGPGRRGARGAAAARPRRRRRGPARLRPLRVPARGPGPAGPPGPGVPPPGPEAAGGFRGRCGAGRGG